MATFCNNQQYEKESDPSTDNKTPTVSKELLNINPKRGIMESLYVLKTKSKTFKPESSKALKEVKAFLPIVEKCGEKLENIEDVEENQPYISMDIQLVEFPCEDSSNSETDSDNEDFSPVTCKNIMIKKQNNKKELTIEDIT